MNQDKELREHIVKLLQGGQAYAPFDAIVANFPADKINDFFLHGDYSAYALLEHIRRTQFDILNFMTNPEYEEPQWPKDYWPAKTEKATKEDWDATIENFKDDREALIKLVQDQKTNLYDKVPQGDGQTFLREFLLAADHNSYHLGEFSIMRQVMKTWGKDHK